MVQQPASSSAAAKKAGFLKGVMATLCHHCPVCRYGRKSPESLVGRILHHPFHAAHCPFWRAERELYGEAPAEGGSE